MPASQGTGFPSRPLRMIIPYPAGGATDVVARLITPAMSRRLGQQVVVDNRGGGAGIIGTGAVARSPADGYTLALVLDTTP
jgi:tripartite-type tricarboxylate transporter receptor subunit TctC